MRLFHIVELSEQKQPYDVVFPPSPQPAAMPRTMVLMGPTAQLAREEYSGTWLINILCAKAVDMVDASSIAVKECVGVIVKSV